MSPLVTVWSQNISERAPEHVRGDPVLFRFMLDTVASVGGRQFWGATSVAG